MTNKMTIYYAYIHAKPDGTPFYVGKGKGRRAWKFKERNQRHMRTVAKYGEHNILIGQLDCSSEAVAFDLEVGLIKCLRRMGVDLCNMTLGGEGASGAVASTETRALLSAQRKGKKQHAEWVAKRVEKKRGRTLSDAVKQTISDKLKAHYSVPENVERLRQQSLGRSLSESARAKVSAANKGKVVSEATKARTAAAVKAWWVARKANRADS